MSGFTFGAAAQPPAFGTATISATGFSGFGTATPASSGKLVKWAEYFAKCRFSDETLFRILFILPSRLGGYGVELNVEEKLMALDPFHNVIAHAPNSFRIISAR